MHLTAGSWAEDLVGRKMATFTALNGGEAKSPEAQSGSPSVRRAASEERLGSHAPAQESRSADVSSNQREPWSGRSGDRPSYQPSSYVDVEGSHKRKRSTSPASREQQPQAESRDIFRTSQREREYRQYEEEKRDHDLWYSQQQQQQQQPPARDERSPYEQQNSAGSVPPQTEEQIGDALRKGTAHADTPHDYSPTSPDADEGSIIYGGPYGASQRNEPVQSDPKKRKRNFSNRTKTGCMTCRKRKKKCDETKPECMSYYLNICY
jgi:hypothetical protein